MLMGMIKLPLNMSKNLLIHYVLLAGALLCGGALVTTAWTAHRQEGKIEKLATSNIQKDMLLREKDAVIEQLRKEQKLDEEALRNLEDVRKRLLAASQDKRNRLRELEKNDAGVSKYLNIPIPSELARVLNAPSPAASSPRLAPDSGAVTALPTASRY